MRRASLLGALGFSIWGPGNKPETGYATLGGGVPFGTMNKKEFNRKNLEIMILIRRQWIWAMAPKSTVFNKDFIEK